MPPGVYARKPHMRSNTGGTLIPPEEKRAMAEWVRQGFSLSRIAREFKCSRATVARAAKAAA